MPAEEAAIATPITPEPMSNWEQSVQVRQVDALKLYACLEKGSGANSVVKGAGFNHKKSRSLSGVKQMNRAKSDQK